ncbi:hypothetical protein VLK31_00945 [Variovorax sp. H27-G14]|uniref:hypothetical protein n=1 Tax=Variovorax sp. H27-G14 TaxID=3111914 RepID=UPI0038FC49AB
MPFQDPTHGPRPTTLKSSLPTIQFHATQHRPLKPVTFPKSSVTFAEMRSDAATKGMTEIQVAVALSQIDAVWEQLFPLEQHRIVQLLVERIVVSPNETQVHLHSNGIENLALDVVRTASRKTANTIEEAPA